MRQAKSLARRSRQSLEEAHQAVSDTEAGRQLKGLANGERSHEKAKDWQARASLGRAEERSMHHFGSEALARFAAERHYSWLENYMGWLERQGGSVCTTTRSWRRNSQALGDEPPISLL